jgi:ribonuclease D
MRHWRGLELAISVDKIAKIEFECINLQPAQRERRLISPLTPPFSRTNISHDEVNALPLGAFDGKVTVIEDHSGLRSAFQELVDYPVVGFDTETKPVFVKGHKHKVALMQLALPGHVFLVRIKSTGVTDDVISFLESHSILKAGVGVRDDIKALQHLNHFTPAGFVELAELSRQAGLEVESVKKLTALLLGFRISKSAQTSNWEAEHLDSRQVSYAATDAWVCLKIYDILSRIEKRPQ